jgi:predicted ribosome quality control (RQC) complex YloA/Tae2 family protein
MQTALHILNLTAELRDEPGSGAAITGTAFYKKERTACFYLKKKGCSQMVLVFSFHPSGYGFYLVPASKLAMNTREKPWPVFALDGAEAVGFEQLGLDRILKMNVLKDGQPFTVVFEALGINGNIWLVDENGNPAATLRNRKMEPGEKYRPPEPLAKLDPFELTRDAVLEVVKTIDKPTTAAVLVEKYVIGYNRTMALETACRSGLDYTDIRDLDSEAIDRLIAQVTWIAERFREVSTGYLYTVRRNYEVFPFKLKCVEDEPEKFKTLSLAVMAMAGRRQTVVEEAWEEKNVLVAVERAVNRYRRRLEKIREDIREAENYESYKTAGELLKINMDALKKGMSEIKVEDVFQKPHRLVVIALEKALSPQENIENYFKKYRKGREGRELLKRRLEISRGEYEALLKMQAELENSFDRAAEKYRSEISSLLPKEGRREAAAPRLPYKEYRLSTGLTIFVGRDGADNDRTTFEFARPYELWFHAQQCPGSHVVMKYPNKAFVPSKKEIEETAAVAAYHSKAKNDSLVPVVYAERRYVRKPRKAKPGLVTVEREKSIMVAPRKPE